MSEAANIVNINEHRTIVKADIENGYDRVAHTINDAFAKNSAELSGGEFQVIFTVIAKTYRWHKKFDWISYEQIADKTGKSKKHIGKLVRSLIAKKVLLKDGNKIGINPVVSEWKSNQLVAKKQPISSRKKATNRTPNGNQLVATGNQLVAKRQPIVPPQKKETITKEITTKETKGKKPLSIPELPCCISKDSLLEFIEHRKQIKKPMTELALIKFIKKLETEYQNGYDISKLIDNAIASGWQTVYPRPADKAKQAGGFGRKGQQALDVLNDMEFD